MLWILKRTDIAGYDQYLGFVVRANTEEEARKIAKEQACGMWGPATCEQLKENGESGVILEAFNAG